MLPAITTTIKHSLRIFRSRSYSAGFVPLTRLLAQMTVQQFLDERDALVLEKLHMLLDPTIQWKRDLPRLGEDLRIVNRRFVTNVAGIERRITFHHVKGITMVVTRAIEPGLIVEVLHVDDQRVTLPMAIRPSHPRIGR